MFIPLFYLIIYYIIKLILVFVKYFFISVIYSTQIFPMFFGYKSNMYLTLICSIFLDNCVLKSKQHSKSTMAHAILDYIKKHFSQDITLHDISNHLGYEYHYCSRFFKQSFKSMLNQYRFKYAQELLIKSDKNICDIAFESDFGNIRNFN